MSYSDFTFRKVKQTFGINTIENQKFLPEIKPIAASGTLTDFLAESLPLAIATARCSCFINSQPSHNISMGFSVTFDF